MYCKQVIPDVSGNLHKHQIKAIWGEPSYIICPQDSKAEKRPWVFAKDMKSNFTSGLTSVEGSDKQ
jgi:hypothetical protein